MREVVVLGVAMTPFGKFLDKSLKDLGKTATWAALKDANVPARDIQVAYVGNSIGGLITGQEAIRGQTVLAHAGLGGIPIVNVENACASASTAFRGVWLEIASGMKDVGLALGVEKMHLGDREKTIAALITTSDIDFSKLGMQPAAEIAMKLKRYMGKYGVTKEDLAKVTVKNSYNGSLNPYAFHQKAYTLEQILKSPVIAEPLHLYMTSSIADGAAAAVLCAREVAQKYTSKPLVRVEACVLRSGRYTDPWDTDTPSVRTLAAREAYEWSGIGPEEVNVVEVHDAMAPVELIKCEELGFCNKGEAVRLLTEGRTKITGDIPINTSGGISARGHPLGATGIAQICELVWQLRGEAGQRQVKNPRVALAEDSGGVIDGDNAAFTIIMLKR